MFFSTNMTKFQQLKAACFGSAKVFSNISKITSLPGVIIKIGELNLIQAIFLTLSSYLPKLIF